MGDLVAQFHVRTEAHVMNIVVVWGFSAFAHLDSMACKATQA